MKNASYRCIICLCGTILIFISMGLLSNAFSIYFPFLMAERNFTNTQISLLTTMRNITSLLSTFLSARYYRKLEIKRGAAIALCFAVISYAIYGLASTPTLCYLAAACSGVCYGIGGTIPASILIQRWFPTHSGTAMGIAASGSGIASILGPLVLTFLIQTFGLSAAFLMEAAFMAVLAVPTVILIRNWPGESADAENASGAACTSGAPSDSGSACGSGAPSDSNAACGSDAPSEFNAARVSESAAESGAACGSGAARVFRPVRSLTRHENTCVLIAMFLIGTLGITGFSSLTLLFTSAGHPVETVSLLLSAAGIVLTVGKFSFGWFADRVGSPATVTGFSLSLMAGQLLCCFANRAGMPVILINLLFLGMGLAISTVAVSVIAADFTAEGQYDMTIRNYQLAYALGGLLSSPVPGVLADRTGSYIPAFFLLFLASVAIFFLLVPLYRRLYL